MEWIIPTFLIAVVVFGIFIGTKEPSITSNAVDLYSGKHNGKFRIVQKGGQNKDMRKLQVETEDGWKDVKTWADGLGGGHFMLVSHNSANIKWFADSIIEDYKERTSKIKVDPIYL